MTLIPIPAPRSVIPPTPINVIPPTPVNPPPVRILEPTQFATPQLIAP